jgi:hypothetical protein
MTSLLRRGSAALAVLLFFVFVLPLSSARAATPTDSALDWLSNELSANGHQLGFKGAAVHRLGPHDRLRARARGRRRATASETKATAANISASGELRHRRLAGKHRAYAGPMGKLLYMTKVMGVDSSNLGGLNIETELRSDADDRSARPLLGSQRLR